MAAEPEGRSLADREGPAILAGVNSIARSPFRPHAIAPCALALLAAAPAGAQDFNPAEIIVTGERQSRTAIETSSSVAVVTDEDIEAASADRMDDLLANIPNVQLGSGGEGPTIRGLDSTGVLRDLPAFLGGNRPRVTLQVDGRDVGYNEFAFGTAPLWDVTRVEVFRSPQTTTQGRNSIAGAIFVETADPTFTWEGRARVLATSETAEQASAAVSGPLIADQLAFRLSGDVRRGHSSSELTSPARGIDPNRDDYEVLRAKLLATPDFVPGLRLEANYTKTSTQAPQVEGIDPPFEERRDVQATYGIFRTDVDAVTLRAEQLLSPGLTANATASFGDSAIRRFAPPGFGETRIEGQDRSLELVVDWSPRGDFQLLVGTHVLRNDLDQRIDLTAANLGVGLFTDRQDSLGLFGEAEWHPLPRVELIVGGRYQRDEQDRFGTLGTALREVPLDYEGRFEAFLPKVSVSYEFADHVRAGLLVQRAYNPGGTTLSLATFAPDTFEAETLWDYELFGRLALPDGKLTLSGNLFHYAIRNAQRSLIRELATPGGTVFFADTANAPRARSTGAEVQVSWRPTSAFGLDASLGLLDTELTEALSDADPLLGKEFQRSPHLSASLAAHWSPAEAVLVTAQLRHGSGYYSDDANDPARRIPASTTVDARAEWRQENVMFFAFARNLFDNFYLTYLFAAASGLATAGDPRELGIGMEAEF